MVEILVVKKKREGLKFKVTERKHKGYAPNKFERVLLSQDATALSLLLYDLSKMGLPIQKAIKKYQELEEDPGLFFLK